MTTALSVWLPLERSFHALPHGAILTLQWSACSVREVWIQLKGAQTRTQHQATV